MRHLSTLIEPRREGGRQRVAVWAHSAAPQVEVDPPRYVASLESEGDGVLERARTVARFSIAGDRLGDVRGNPNIAFDMIFNDEPWPADPDDNLVKRSAALLATASEFIRGLERSLGLRPPIHPARRSLSHVHGPQQISWGPVDLTGSPHAAQIAEAFSSSDVSLAAHWDDEGNLTMLIKTETAVYGRPIPPALRLDPGKRQGSAAEDAALAAASIWGLPDFVLSPKQMEKGSAQREIGDGTIITDGRGLAVQVKSREAMSGNPARERNWLLKKAKEGARQAAGTVRSLRMGPTTLINGRGRAVPCDGSQVAWVRVVILDHGAPPQDIVPMADDTDLPVVTLLRRDWEFLFDQLRSVSAVVDYVHRAASDGPRPLGDEPVRYYELADADEQAAEDAPVHWIDRLGAQQSSHPILPKAPASSADVTGHAVFRVILEDIAEGPFERDETDRLQVLALLDRFSVAERAHLGRLLLEHLNDVTKAPPETTLWRSRRVIQDSGRLHLAFSACSQFTELHREAFRQWTMLRHHEFVTAGVTPEGETPWTIAVLLTPRHDGYRPWDTTMIAIHDALDLSPDEIAGMRSLWNPNSQQEPA